MSNSNVSELISYNNLIKRELRMWNMTISSNLESKCNEMMVRIKNKCEETELKKF